MVSHLDACVLILDTSKQMKLFINQKETHTQVTDLAGLIAERNIPLQGIAVAVNSQIIPRQQWSHHLLCDNDQVMVISATRGG